MFTHFGLRENGFLRVLGSLELSIMEAMWSAGQPVTIRDVCDALAHTEKPPAFTTVMTVMNRLALKGLLARTGSRKRYQFSASVSKAELQARVSQSVVQEILADFGPIAVTHFVEAVSSDPGKLLLLESLLGKREQVEQNGGKP